MPKKILNPQFITKTMQNRLYQIPVPIIGLTGGIATGKSTVAKILKDKNIPLIDADQLVKLVYKNSAVVDFIRREFAEAINKTTQEIDFKILRKIAFNNSENIKKIETLIYQYLPAEFKNAFQHFNSPAFIVYDVPLLFEKGLDQLVDVKICVYSPANMQIERLVLRDHINAVEAQKILDHQLNIEIKKSKADFVIENTGTQTDLILNTEKLLEQILQ